MATCHLRPALALVLLLGCGFGASTQVEESPARAAASDEHTRWIPLEVHRNLIFAAVEVQGRPATALVDSRSSQTLISMRLADELQLEERGSSQVTGVGGSRPSSLLQDLQLGLGGWQLVESTAMSIDLQAVSQLAGKEFDMVVGTALFTNFVVDLDVPRRRMGLSEPAAYRHACVAGADVPLRLAGDSLQVEARIEDLEPEYFDLDTGSTGRLHLYPQYWEPHELLVGREPRSTSWGGGIGGGTVSDIATLSSFALGPFELTELPATFYRDAAARFTTTAAGGNLGNGVLRRFRTVFDVPGGRLHLDPAPGWDEAFSRERAGLAFLLREGELETLHVSKGSPAELLGWRVGERIRAIDGEPVRTDYWAGQDDWADGPAGTRVVLTLSDGTLRELVLADYY